jgi:hypothetical protein
MIDLIPWRRLKIGAPVNKPGTEWFNAVTSALTTMTAEWTNESQPSIDRPNPDGTFWRIKIPAESPLTSSWHFYVSASSDQTSLYVSAGTYTCNGTRWAKSTVEITGNGNDIDGYSNTIPDTAYIYLEKYHTNPATYVDVSLNQDDEGVKIVCADTFPSENTVSQTYNRQQYWLLAVVTMNGGTVSNIDRCWVGDIDELTVVPDGNESNFSQYPVKTLSWTARLSMGMYGAGSSTLESGTAWSALWGIPAMKKAASGTGTLAWVEVDVAPDTRTIGSIEIINGKLQLYNYHAGATNEQPNASLLGDPGWELCMRTGTSGTLKWVEAKYAKVNRAVSADTILLTGLDQISINHTSGDLVQLREFDAPSAAVDPTAGTQDNYLPFRYEKTNSPVAGPRLEWLHMQVKSMKDVSSDDYVVVVSWEAP